jgi:hypothetical protein
LVRWQRLRGADRNLKATRHDGARELLARGFDPGALLHVQHAGRAFDPTVVPRPIGELAERTYEERDKDGLKRRRWRPFEMPRNGVAVASRTGRDASSGTKGHAASVASSAALGHPVARAS